MKVYCPLAAKVMFADWLLIAVVTLLQLLDAANPTVRFGFTVLMSASVGWLCAHWHTCAPPVRRR